MTEKSTARKNTEHALRASGERRKPIPDNATQALQHKRRVQKEKGVVG
jgi:hypothetical protein